MKNYNAILIGNGTMGKRHRSRFEECGVVFRRVLDIDGLAWIESEDALSSESLEIRSLDFAVIASPASTHYGYARFFLERGIPVLVEKPLATSAADARKLVELARRNETLLFVAQSECYNPIFLNFRKHFVVDLKRAVAASKSTVAEEGSLEKNAATPLNVRLKFRREHGYSPRCRDVDVSLDLLVHDVSLFLNLFDAGNVVIVDDGRNEPNCGDRIRMTLKVSSGEYAGVEAEFIADRNSAQDVRSISVEFGRNGSMPGFDHSVSLARYTVNGEVDHVPDSLDNEHRFFLKLLGGACGNWASRAMVNAANAVILATGETP